MNRLSVLLVHGFSGSERDLLPLAGRMREVFGRDSVQLLQLPGHTGEGVLAGFDLDSLLEEISTQLKRLRRNADTLVVVGHSTGGNLLLAALEKTSIVPDLLVLAATPFRVDLTYLDRWQQHSKSRADLSLTTLSGLIKLINTVADCDSTPPCPTLILQGGEDCLVPPQEAQFWRNTLAGEVRFLDLPTSGHQIFGTNGWEVAVEALLLEISATLTHNEEYLQKFAQCLIDAEPEAHQFVTENRAQLRHLAMSPSGRRLQSEVAMLPERVPWGPVFVNIEITTFCNLNCRYCARTDLRPSEKMMSKEMFENLLDRLPSAYRVTLVGLGEPLLHPQLSELIALAKARGRRVGMVTNAQLLSSQCSAEILAAGLDSIAFSLDTVDTHLLSEIRAGSDLAIIEANIYDFCAQADKLTRPVSKAVFSAVSAASLDGLENLIVRVASLGVQVLMLSDLNFLNNQKDSLSSNVDAEQERQIRRIIARGFSQGLPVLGVRALEDFGLAQGYKDALLLPVQQLYRRSEQHRHCFSPWQTLSINVDGEICLCDCQSERSLGNLQQQSLASLWNGSAMREQRRRMLGEQPSNECLICPRF